MTGQSELFPQNEIDTKRYSEQIAAQAKRTQALRDATATEVPHDLSVNEENVGRIDTQPEGHARRASRLSEARQALADAELPPIPTESGKAWTSDPEATAAGLSGIPEARTNLHTSSSEPDPPASAAS